MHWRGIEPRSPAWQARILPLNHQCDVYRVTFNFCVIILCYLVHLRCNERTLCVQNWLYSKQSQIANSWGYSSVVEHSTADREVTGSNPVVPLFSSLSRLNFDVKFATSCTYSRLNALAGNRTPVSRVAGKNSTTEPPMRCIKSDFQFLRNYTMLLGAFAL